MYIYNTDQFSNTDYSKSLNNIPYNNPDVDYCSLGIWLFKPMDFESNAFRSLNEEITYWSKCLNASVYNYTSSTTNIYPDLSSQYLKSTETLWSLPLSQGPGIGQKGHFIPDRAIENSGVNYTEISYISTINIDINSVISNIRIDQEIAIKNDTILLTSQTITSQNGLYLVDNFYKLIKKDIDLGIPQCFIAKKGKYNISKEYQTKTDPNGIVYNPLILEPTDRLLIRNRLEYKTKRTFTFRCSLPDYNLVFGDNGLILDIDTPSTTLVDTRWALYSAIEDDKGILWTSGNRGTIMKSIDQGNTWSNIFIETEAGFRWSGSIGDYVVFIGERASVYYTKDSGLSFTKVKIPRRYTKDFISGYLDIDSVSKNPILWVVGLEGTFLEVDIINQTSQIHILESDLRNEATLGNLNKIIPLKNNFLILGNDIVGFFNRKTKKYCDLYPLELSDINVSLGEPGSGRNWAGFEIWAQGSTQDIIYLFSEKGEIFSLEITYDIYNPDSCPLSTMELIHSLDLGDSLLTSISPTENNWLVTGSRRGLWNLDYFTFNLVEIPDIDPLFQNKFLILDYFMARKFETVVNNEKIVPILQPSGNFNILTGITYISFDSDTSSNGYFDWYKSHRPTINNFFEKRNSINEYTLTGLTSISTSLSYIPSGTDWVGPNSIDSDFFNLSGVTGINKFITGSSITLFIDWIDGFSNQRSLIRELDIISNNLGVIEIPRIIEDSPQLNAYNCNVQLWLNPFGIDKSDNFYLSLYALGFTGPSSIVTDINIGDYINNNIKTNGINILDEGFVLKQKSTFGNSDLLIFEDKVPNDLINNINRSLHFNRSTLDILNINRFSDDNTINNVIENHPLSQGLEITSDLLIKGKMNYLTSYFNLTCSVSIKDNLSNTFNSNLSYSGTDTTWNPGYTLLNFLTSLSPEITTTLEIDDLKLNSDNLINISFASTFGDRLLVYTNYDKNIENLFKKFDKQNQWVDLVINNIVYTVLIKGTKFIEDQSWILVLDKSIGIEYIGPIVIKGRHILEQISSDLESTDDIHFKLIRKSNYSSKARLGGIANALMRNTIIKKYITAILYLDDQSNIVVNTLDISDDPNMVYRPVDIFRLGSDNQCRDAVYITNSHFLQINPDWKKSSVGKASKAELINVNFSRVRYRLIDSLTLQKIHDKHNWILNAHMDLALIGQDDKSSIIWYLGQWYCGYFEGGRWASGDWYGGIWQTGIWDSLVVEDLYNRARIIEDLPDGHASNWWSGTWKTGIFNGGTWWGGIWKDGDYVDGLWQNGIWENGNHHGGTWRGGTWRNGTFLKGFFNGRNYRSVWQNGLWSGGDFENGLWVYGIFESSNISPSRFGTDVTRYHRAIWKDGIWKDGIFMARTRDKKRKNYKMVWHWSTWENGTWYNGHFKCGEFKQGLWKTGLWFDGIFGTGETADTDAIWNTGFWMKGTWTNGIFKDGTIEHVLWIDGTFEKGDIALQYKRTRKRKIPKRRTIINSTTGGRNRNIRVDISDNRDQLLDTIL